MKEKGLLMLAFLLSIAQGIKAWDGNGTAESPYILANAADWAAFANKVNDGTYADKHFKLSDTWDNSAEAVTATVGTDQNPFQGTFDGNGKTLHVNINETTTQGTAPFRNVRGATVKNITVEGSVTGTYHTAGLVGFVRTGGTTTISDCIVKTIVNNYTGYGKGYMGGVMGHGTKATIVIKNTIFSGYLNSTSDYAGGLQGWSDGNTLTIINSFFLGSYSHRGLFHPIALQYYDKTTQYTNNGAYYISTVPPVVADNRYIAGTGKPIYSEPVPGVNYSKIKAPDGQEYYVEAFFYNVCSWDAENKKVVSTLTPCPTFYVLEGNHTNDWIGLTDGFYLVKGEATYNVLNIMGSDVHLILADNATLTCSHVKLEDYNKLHIHGCSEGTGKLNVENHHYDISVSRKSTGGSRRHYKIAGIYKGSAGIGGGDNAYMGSLYVHGGIINVNQGGSGAGIGGGKDAGIGGELVVYDGTVTVKVIGQKGNGAAIGGGKDHSQGGPVTIYGGSVTANGLGDGAAIGGEDGGHGGLVTIWGGNVHTKSGTSSAAIGGGYKGNGGTVYIYGGNVYAEAGSFQSTSLMGCGIGGGYAGAGGEVHILGGTVEAFGGNHCSAIGAHGDKPLGTIELADNLKVTAGDASFYRQETIATPERVFTASEREAACQWRKWAKIEACDHTKPTIGSDHEEPLYYTVVDETYHTKHCRYCNVTIKEPHSGSPCVCGHKSRVVFNFYVPDVNNKDTYALGHSSVVGAGTKYPIPQCPIVPDGYTFTGWEMNPAPEDINKWAYVLGDDLIQPMETMEALHGMNNANFYARYLYKFTSEWTWDPDTPATSVSVTIKHPHLPDQTYTASDTQMTITSDDMTNIMTFENEDGTLSDEEVKIGTRYTATCTFTVDGNEYTVIDAYEAVDVNDITDIVINDNADNSEILMENDGNKANVTLSGRTFRKDGSWNTLCLPFDVKNLKGTPLEGATVKVLAASDFNSTTSTMTLSFSDSRHTIAAGIPYIVKWTTTGQDITNPVFHDVVIEATANSIGSMYVDFAGTFSPTGLEQNNRSVLFLSENNKLYYSKNDINVNACRAYFKLHNDITAIDLNTSGDINGDGFINVVDVTLLVNYILGNEAEDVILENADVSSDGEISVTDVTALVNLILRGGNSILNLVITGADGITFGGAGNGPARARIQ